LNVAGDSAVVMTTGATSTSLLRVGSSGISGSVEMGSGAVLAGPAVRLDGSRSLALSQQAEFKSNDVGITAGRLAIGTPSAPTDATVLDGRLLDSIRQIASLTLGSSQSIDFYGSQTLSLQQLVLDAPTLRGIGTKSDMVQLNAERVVLRNSTAFSPNPGASGASSLVINAAPPLSDVTSEGLTVGQVAQSGTGAIALDFGSTRLHTSGDVVFTGIGSLASSGPVTVEAARVTASSGASHGITVADQTLRFATTADAGTLGNLVGAGAALNFSAQRIEQAGRIEASSGTLSFRAAGKPGEAAITFAAGSITSAAGFSRQVSNDWSVYGSAGRIEARAATGDVVVAGELNAGASGTGHAGTIVLAAADISSSQAGSIDLRSSAALVGAAASGRRQGTFSIDAGQLKEEGAATAKMDGYAAALAKGGFGGEVVVRVRSGDVALDQATLRAERVTISSDRGSVNVGGRIDARSATGGVVRIFGHNDVSISGTIDAASTRAGANGGDVLLAAVDGSVALGRAARIDASGDSSQDGRLVLRGSRSDGDGTVAAQIAAGFDSTTQLLAGEIDVEAVRRYTEFTSLGTGNSSGTRLGQASILEDAQTFADRSTGVLDGLGLGSDARAHLRSGVEIIADSAFTVLNDWNLWSVDRPGGEPGFLTIRAAGNLQVNGSISDGFASAVRPGSPAAPTALMTGDSWSYRLVGGADVTSADLMAVAAGAPADLNVANTKLIRTTSGSIEMAASRDINLAPTSLTTQQAVVYVAGKPSAINDPSTLNDAMLRSGTWTAQMTSQGGRVELAAGRDVVGAPPSQLFGGWFYHTGLNETPTAWWTGFDAFRQGVGSFGGGDLRVTAGRDIRNLGFSSPTSALAAAPLPRDSTPPSEQPLPVLENGGNIEVVAGRDIAGGSVLLGRGEAHLRAGRDVTVGTGGAVAVNRAPVLGLIDGRIEIEATGSAQVAAAYNPTMAPQGRRISPNDGSLYLTYAPGSAVAITSVAGDVAWVGGDLATYWAALVGRNGNEGTPNNTAYQNLFALAPPTLKLTALGRDASVTVPSASSGLTLSPSSAGNLEIYAARNLGLSGGTGTTGAPVWLYVSDQSPDTLPTVAQPFDPLQITPNSFRPPRAIASFPFDGIHAGDSHPVRLHADGSIEFVRRTGVSNVSLIVPKAAEISAGGDIRNVSLIGQHLAPSDVTLVNAGGSIIQTAGAVNDRVTLAGPGELRIEAGRQLDLGTSQGVESVGNLYNAALPSGGAAIVLAAGMKGQLNPDTFYSQFLSLAPGSAAEQAAAFADQYLSALGKDPQSLTADDRALRTDLIERYTRFLEIQGVDNGVTVEARRSALVREVRRALGQEPLADADLAAAFDSAWAQFQALSTQTQVAFAQRLLAQTFGQTYFADGKPYAQHWQQATAEAAVDPAVYQGAVFERVRRQVLFEELNSIGSLAALIPAGSKSVRDQTYALGFQAIDLAGMGNSLKFAGDLDLVASGAQTLHGGAMTMFAPGGQINVGLPGTSGARGSGPKGVVVYERGDLSALADGDFQVNSQKTFVIGEGDISVWSSKGSIDTGLGANTALLIPPVVPKRDEYGGLAFVLPSLAIGSGIGILDPAVGKANGNIGLYAPNGEVRALDAKIRAPGRITLAANVVRGADNIVGGSVVGAPPAVTAPTGIGLAAPSAGSSDAQANAAASGATRAQLRERNGLLTVELVGMGGDEESCLESDKSEECQKRRNR
jgi:hypothetical protein